jgi:Trypsin-co-occurring domain 2
MWRRRKHRHRRKHQGNDEPVGLGLDEVLAALSQDLVQASDGTLARGGGYGLGVERAEVELSVTVVKETSGTAEATTKVRVLPWGMSAGITGHAELSHQNSYIHRVTLSLIPVIAESASKILPRSEPAARPQGAEPDNSIWSSYRSPMINAGTERVRPNFFPPATNPYVPGVVSPTGDPARRETYSPGTGRPVAEGIPTIRTDVQAKKDKE